MAASDPGPVPSLPFLGRRKNSHRLWGPTPPHSCCWIGAVHTLDFCLVHPSAFIIFLITGFRLVSMHSFIIQLPRAKTR